MDFSPLPISAYTLSLAFSITYRQLQRAKLTNHQLLARDNLSIFHQSLQSLSSTWWLAAVMMHVGKQALESSQRTVTKGQCKPQLPTSQLNEVSRSRSPLIQYPILPPVNHNTSQTDTRYLNNCGAPQGNLNTLEDPLSATSLSSDLDPLFEYRDLLTSGGDYLENFFENFLDVNFPTYLGDQSLEVYDSLTT